ncbi:DUF6244 family protein [Polymorphospora lycopeni]|uniref:DUF6244 family protein n=1 Tax=Polymorphospora lycopeni TaxID=3140240 RepID=A0ABV5CSK6_9ACTN
MSPVEGIGDKLRSMTEGITRTLEAITAADNIAGQMVEDVARSGFTHIGHGIVQLRAAVRELQARVAALGESINTTRTRVAQIPDQPSPQEIISVLTPVLDALTAMRNGIGATITKATEVQYLAIDLLRGGQPGPILACLDAVKQLLARTGQRGDATKVHAEALLSEARKTGGAGPTQSDDTGTERPLPAPGHRSANAPLPSRYDPAKADEIRPYVGRDKAVGRLYGSDGEPVGDLLFSGQSGPGKGGPGLAGRWRHLESLTEHTEGHAAALVREHGIEDAAPYLNMHPCRKPEGCHRNIDKALRPGSRLTVWVVNADGSTLRRRYEGNGEALEK